MWSLVRHRNAKQPEPLTGAEGHGGAFSAALGTAIPALPISERPGPFLPSLARAKAHQEKGGGRYLNEQLEAIYCLVYENIFLTTFKEN